MAPRHLRHRLCRKCLLYRISPVKGPHPLEISFGKPFNTRKGCAEVVGDLLEHLVAPVVIGLSLNQLLVQGGNVLICGALRAAVWFTKTVYGDTQGGWLGDWYLNGNEEPYSPATFTARNKQFPFNEWQNYFEFDTNLGTQLLGIDGNKPGIRSELVKSFNPVGGIINLPNNTRNPEIGLEGFSVELSGGKLDAKNMIGAAVINGAINYNTIRKDGEDYILELKGDLTLGDYANFNWNDPRQDVRPRDRAGLIITLPCVAAGAGGPYKISIPVKVDSLVRYSPLTGAHTYRRVAKMTPRLTWKIVGSIVIILILILLPRFFAWIFGGVSESSDEVLIQRLLGCGNLVHKSSVKDREFVLKFDCDLSPAIQVQPHFLADSIRISAKTREGRWYTYDSTTDSVKSGRE